MSSYTSKKLRFNTAEQFKEAFSETDASVGYVFISKHLPWANEASPDIISDTTSTGRFIWNNMIAAKKVTGNDVELVIPRADWTANVKYRQFDDTITLDNLVTTNTSTNVYAMYIMNSERNVYKCLSNNLSANSTVEPLGSNLGAKGIIQTADGYLWKYLYTIKPSDIVKFESTTFMPVPLNWETSIDNASVRDNAVDGSIKIITITNRGIGLGTANVTYTRVPIKGDGTGAECTITIDNDQKVDSIVISNQGSGYTYGNVDLIAGNVPTGSVRPTFDVIIPPKGGHGADIYRELGAYNVLVYSRIENDSQNPDFITGNQIARVGIVENPNQFGSTQLLTTDKASAVYAIRLTGVGYSSATFTPDSLVTQTYGKITH